MDQAYRINVSLEQEDALIKLCLALGAEVYSQRGYDDPDSHRKIKHAHEYIYFDPTASSDHIGRCTVAWQGPRGAGVIDAPSVGFFIQKVEEFYKNTLKMQLNNEYTLIYRGGSEVHVGCQRFEVSKIIELADKLKERLAHGNNPPHDGK